MPIAVVAVAEFILAAVLAIWTLISSGPEEGVSIEAWLVLTALAVTAVNAVLILRTVRGRGSNPSATGLWIAAIGGVLLLAIGSSNLWIGHAFPPVNSFTGFLEPLVYASLTLDALTLAALVSLLVGWGKAALRRWRRRRQPV